MLDFILSYLLAPFLKWDYYIIGLIVILIVSCKRFNCPHFFPLVFLRVRKIISKISYKALISAVLGFKILASLSATLAQYHVWSNSEFTKLLLNKNVIDFSILESFSGKLFWIFNNKFGYLLFYSWGRFWLEIVVSLLIAIVFYLFLLLLRKYRNSFFEEGETKIGFLLALTVGWPNFIVFLAMSFLSVVGISIIRFLFFKKAYTTLGVPFLVSALTTILLGNYFIGFLGLSAFGV
jgi:hypothetical protein